MKVTTRGRYGLEVLVALALQEPGKPVPLKVLTDACGLSETYLVQIFMGLRRARIVHSVRGSMGGFQLARPADTITVAQALEALEGAFHPVECLDRKRTACCPRIELCAARTFWQEMQARFLSLAGSLSLAELADCSRAQVRLPSEPDYYL